MQENVVFHGDKNDNLDFLDDDAPSE